MTRNKLCKNTQVLWALIVKRAQGYADYVAASCKSIAVDTNLSTVFTKHLSTTMKQQEGVDLGSSRNFK